MKTSDQQFINNLENDLRSNIFDERIGKVIYRLLKILHYMNLEIIELKNKLGYCQIITLKEKN